ncbi:Hypothetical protein, partial CDS, partial [Neorhizobium galegae bv. orientalis]
PRPASAPASQSPPPARPVQSSTPPMRGTADTLLGGLSLNDIVAEASRASRAEHGTAMPSAPLRGHSTVPPSYPASPSLEMGNSQDRLKSVLKEIEEAAARARAWRHDPNRN